MEMLWRQEAPVTVREVHEFLSRDRDVAYTTVMTVLDRLARKHAVHQLRDGRAFRYSAALTREDLTAELMHDALDTIGTASDRAAALVRFVDTVSAEDAAALRAALAEVEATSDNDAGAGAGAGAGGPSRA